MINENIKTDSGDSMHHRHARGVQSAHVRKLNVVSAGSIDYGHQQHLPLPHHRPKTPSQSSAAVQPKDINMTSMETWPMYINLVPG